MDLCEVEAQMEERGGKETEKKEGQDSDAAVPPLIRLTDSIVHPMGISNQQVGYPVYYIYILSCKADKVYIGKSKTQIKTISEHRKHWKAEWVVKYPMIDVVAGFENCNAFDADKFVIQTMAEYGVDNVRGGSFDALYLTSDQRAVLLRMIRSSLDLCFLCGVAGHYIKTCYGNQVAKAGKVRCKQKDPTWFERNLGCLFGGGTGANDDDDDEDKKENEKYERNEEKETANLLAQTQIICLRCGREGHWTEQCFAHKHVNGKILK
jgi:hypothetical protein